MRALIVRVAITIAVSGVAIASTLADFNCFTNEDCGPGSTACWANWNGICTYCDGNGTVDMCKPGLGGQCSSGYNEPCGKRKRGYCSTSWGSVGNCIFVISLNVDCSVSGC